MFSKEESPRVKPLLYTYRVLFTGILMRSGEIEANLLTLNEDLRLPFLHELIAQKHEQIAGIAHRRDTRTIE